MWYKVPNALNVPPVKSLVYTMGCIIFLKLYHSSLLCLCVMQASRAAFGS